MLHSSWELSCHKLDRSATKAGFILVNYSSNKLKCKYPNLNIVSDLIYWISWDSIRKTQSWRRILSVTTLFPFIESYSCWTLWKRKEVEFLNIKKLKAIRVRWMLLNKTLSKLNEVKIFFFLIKELEHIVCLHFDE